MNALRKDDSPQFQPTRTRKPRRRQSSAASQNVHQGLVFESTFKLGINILLSSVAIVSLLQLLSYHSTQKSKLEEINREVSKTEIRVNQLRENFNHDFASGAETKVRQKQNNLISPKQLRVVIEPQSELEKFTQISQSKR
jgi:hypothetical protein